MEVLIFAPSEIVVDEEEPALVLAVFWEISVVILPSGAFLASSLAVES